MKRLMRAEKYGNEKMIKRYISKSMLFENFSLWCNVSEFSRFGVGLLMYFRFI